MEYKNDWEEIRKFINLLKERYDFKGLYHFTDFSNLKYIFQHKYLYSRDYCKKNYIDFTDGASHEVLNRDINNVHEKVRFYYRGKTPTLYNNEGVKLEQYCDNIHIPMPVYLLFDEELIYLNSTEFSSGNATTSDVGKTAEFFYSIDWGSVFHRTTVSREERDYIVNKRQAELLSNTPISLEKYLKKIIFRCEADRKRSVNIYGHNPLYEVDINLFSDKNFDDVKKESQINNFIKDYIIDYEYDEYGKKNTLIFECEFQKILSNYNLRFELEDKYRRKYSQKTKLLFDKVEEYYIGKDHNIKNEKENCKIILLKIKINTEEFDKFNVYVNDCLYVEEKLRKNQIEKYIAKVKYIDLNKKLFLKLRFKDLEILNYEHKYEFLDCNNNVIENGFLNLREKKRLSIIKIFHNYNENWYKIKYYIDNVLYICDLVDNKKVAYTNE